MLEEPLKSSHNLKLLRYAIAAVVLIFLIQIVLYTMETRKVEIFEEGTREEHS